MISKSLPWNKVRPLEGNPTRSSKVNDVIKQVKMREAGAKQGAPSKKRRTMETAELEEMIGMIEEMMGTCIIIASSFGSAAYFHYQFNMIARAKAG